MHERVLHEENMDELTQLLSDLVAINSVNPDLVAGGAGEGAVARFIAQWCEAAGLEVRLDEVRPGRPNVIAVARGTGGGRCAQPRMSGTGNTWSSAPA